MRLRLLGQIANPLHRRGLYGLPHAIGIIAVIVFAFSAGWIGRSAYDGHYFATHYQANLQAPANLLPRVSAVPGDLPASASIQISRYPSVGNQGMQGACAAWASAWALSYEFRLTHPAHPGLRFSPAWEYSYYTETYAGGQDSGSWPTQDLEMVPSLGIAQFRVMPAPQAIAPLPTLGPVADNAYRFRMPVTVNTLYAGQPSSVVVGEIKAAISAGHPALVALNVTPSYDNATVTHGLVWDHGIEGNRGGHENVALAYDDTMQFPNGDVGGILLQNQWSRAYGLNGRVWVSYAWATRNLWGVQDIVFA